MNSTPQLRTHPVREARAHAGEEDEDRPVDRRRLPAEDGRRPPDRRGPAALPRGREAAQHLRRRAAAADPRPTGASTPRSSRPTPPPAASRARRPNLQNVPVRTADGREMRRAFIADAGWGLLTADYSQIELRVLAHLAEDPGLIEAFERGADVHTTTAAKVFDVAEADGRRRATPLRQGRELRAGVRDGGLRARPAPRHPDRRGGRDPRRLLRRLPEREGVHGRARCGRPRSAATRPRSSAGAARSPSSRPTTSASVRWGSAWRRTRRCRDRRPTSSSWR